MDRVAQLGAKGGGWAHSHRPALGAPDLVNSLVGSR